ncbi:Cyclopropane-fatty-acyl-phospholipid synthase [hydrothermal vent metagenome]|uniref:Cyclopropane-fatty-acyl-phospholipid synthase n=1 Tax=hydrothermal vent metagenome TaxID=652676 RepID=A0A3B0SK47_9ZZZZ
MRLLSKLLKAFISSGTLVVYDAKGQRHEFVGTPATPVVTMRLHKASLYHKLLLQPDLTAAEAYMDETLTFEDGTDIQGFLDLMVANKDGLSNHSSQKYGKLIRKITAPFQQFNPIKNSRKNASHHYDLSEELYRLFLDKDMQYSCGYFLDPKESLEQAQINKKRRIAAKLDLQDGDHVLDIGCGWGGMGLYLAQVADVKVTGIALAKEQLRVANARAEKMGLSDRVKFEYMDYRELTEKYDKIVSVGMVEHVGARYLDAYFEQISSLLKPGGRAMVHSIGRRGPPGSTNAFIQKYIFPGGYSPSISEAFVAVQNSEMWVADCEVWRLHYYYTIDHWRRRFKQNRAKAVALYDERFARMWEFYLTAVAIGFKHDHNMNFQFILSNQRADVPITRDFIYENEKALAKRGL